MECSKCKKQLDINDAVCRCIDCQQYFCDEEGKILKGTSERINFDFLCYDCNDKISKKRDREAERKEFVRKQSERIIKEQEKKERDEMLMKQLLHASFSVNDNAYNLYDDEKIEMPNFDAFKGGEKWEMDFRGKKAPCSGYVELYGWKWPPFDTPIHLTFSYWKTSIEKDERRNYYEKKVEVEKNYCLRCANKIISGWREWGLKKLDDSFEKREREKEIAKYSH